MNDDGLLDRDEYYGGVLGRFDEDDDLLLNEDEFGLLQAAFELL